MNVVGDKIKLRAIEYEDLAQLQAWSNDPEIQYWLGGWHFPGNKNDIEKWFSSISLKSTNQRFCIETESDGLIGTANIVDIDWKNRNAFHGMLLGDKDIRGKGYGKDTVLTIMKYAFEELGLNRLDGSIIEYNKASHRLYIEKCGWEVEGIKEDWYYRKGRYWDKIVVGITKKRYNEFIQANR